METTKKEKTFDAVKMMPEIRNQISSEIQNMSFEQMKEYIRKQLSESKAKTIRTNLSESSTTANKSSNN